MGLEPSLSIGRAFSIPSLLAPDNDGLFNTATFFCFSSSSAIYAVMYNLHSIFFFSNCTHRRALSTVLIALLYVKPCVHMYVDRALTPSCVNEDNKNSTAFTYAEEHVKSKWGSACKLCNMQWLQGEFITSCRLIVIIIILPIKRRQVLQVKS